MPKRKEPELDPKEQAKRFREAAKEAEVDAEAAERAFKRLSGKQAAASRPTYRKIGTPTR